LAAGSCSCRLCVCARNRCVSGRSVFILSRHRARAKSFPLAPALHPDYADLDAEAPKHDNQVQEQTMITHRFAPVGDARQDHPAGCFRSSLRTVGL
jgi:hypothetical protein